MENYILDTNICIYFFNGNEQIGKKIEDVGIDHCFISEITLAELRYGAEKSQRKEKNNAAIDKLVEHTKVLPFSEVIENYAKERARLELAGLSADQFDLIIGCNAVYYDMILVTRNVKNFKNIEGIRIENWVDDK